MAPILCTILTNKPDYQPLAAFLRGGVNLLAEMIFFTNYSIFLQSETKELVYLYEIVLLCSF